jgi:RNA polymerase sigma factor (sigma-70 family)
MSDVTDVPGDETESLASSVEAARSGDRGALERVILGVQDDVYRLALRMTGCPEEGRDACQEILIKVVTRLDSFREESSIRTWVYRIAVRHLLDRKKSRVEQLAMSFEQFGADLLDGLAAPEAPPDPVMVEEVKLGCTLAMLTCLDREHRLAYLLGDVLDLPHREAAEFCELREETYRQRLSRGRRVLEAFTTSFCGLVSEKAPCRCDRRVARAEQLGRIERGRPRLARGPVREAQREMQSLHETARLMRSHPDYAAPADVLEGVRAALGGGRSRVLG